MSNASSVFQLVLVCSLGLAGCVHSQDKQAFNPPACHVGAFDIYFQPNDVRLSRQAKTEIDALQRALSACKIERVSVIAVPENGQDAALARTISEARADAVILGFGAPAWPRDRFHVLAAEKNFAGARAGDEPILARRARVVIEASAS